VSQAYFEVLRAQDNLVFVRAEKAAVGRQLEQTKQRFEVGESLREITGQEHKDLNILDTGRFTANPSTVPAESLIDEAKAKNLTLLSSRILQDIARDNISLASSGHLPTLSLDGGYNYSDTSHSSSDNTTDYFTIGVNLAVPLYTGGNVTSQTKQAEYAYVAASEALEAQYRSVVKEVRAQNNNINASIGALRAYKQAVISAHSALEATEAGFDVGTRTIVDVLDATRRLYDANKNLSNARYDYILSVLQLRQAVGTLSEQDILDVDAGLKAAK